MSDPNLEQFARFRDRHRAQFGFRICEQPNYLRVEAKGLPMVAITVWIVLVHAVMIGLMLYFRLREDDPAFFGVFVAVMCFEFPAMLAIFFAMSRSELAKGPLLEVDQKKRAAVLLRDKRMIRFDEIEAVFLLVGWYEWTSREWEKVAEMSLIVREAEQVPVVLHNEVGHVNCLAESISKLTGRPIWRDSIASTKA